MKDTKITAENARAVDIRGLMSLLSCGRQTAETIGKASGAAFKVGRRKLYRVSDIDNYLEGLKEA